MTKLVRSWRVWVPILGGAAAVAAILVSVVVLGTDRGTSLTATPYSDVIRFEAAGAASLEVRIFDLSGKEMWSSGIVSDSVLDWDRTNTWGERLAYGSYLYSAQAWDAEGGLLLNRTGKLALLPGDKVQLETAPVVSAVSGEFLPSERDGPVYGPRAYNHTGNFTISGSLGVGTDTPSCEIDVRDNADVARLNLTGTEGSLGSADLRFYDTAAGLLGRVYASAKNKYIGFLGLGNSSFRVFTRNTANTQSVERLRITGAADIATAAFLNSNVGIGTDTPGQKLAVAGTITTTGAQYPDFTVGAGMDLDLVGTNNVWLVPGNNYGVLAFEDLKVYDGNDEPDLQVQCAMPGGHNWGFESSNDGDFEVWNFTDNMCAAYWNDSTNSLQLTGDLYCAGTKYFATPYPGEAGKEITYACREGPEAGIYVRGSARLAGGQARITLPDHFTAIVVEGSLTVQLTPRGTWLRLYVESATAEEIVVAEAEGLSGEFDYEVAGIRQGYEDFQPVRDAVVKRSSSPHMSAEGSETKNVK